MKTLTAQQLNELITKRTSKNIIVDARTPAEYHLEHIEGAINMPYDQFEDYKDTLTGYESIAVYCNSGNTSAMFYKRAVAHGLTNIVNVTGGIAACKGHCPIVRQKGPLPIMQQVQIAAGSLVLLGIILAKGFHGYARHEYFIGISAFVGAGLVFAGVSGRCGMAKLLGRMPRNNVKKYTAPTTLTGKNLLIKQFEDQNLAHYSYMAISNGQAVVVDPERDPQKYYDYAKQNNATIVGVLNTHPHADFASGHLQIHQETGATIYVGDKVGAEYAHTAVTDQTTIPFGSSQIVCYFTPGHSPDSISYLAKDENGKQVGFFTGDWLFIGDVGRADLRETVGNIKAKQEELAGMMYDTTRTILPQLSKDIMILPAHGAGTSCGKGLSKQSMDILANQRKYNPMLLEMTREDFVKELTSDQPAIPAYFTNSVLLNKKGNNTYTNALQDIKKIDHLTGLDLVRIVDTRSQQHSIEYPIVENSITIPYDNKAFIGMVGALIQPTEQFVLVIEKHSQVNQMLHDILSIGYENNLTGIYVIEDLSISHKVHHKDLETSDYQILDVRSASAYELNMVHPDAINIPIEQLISRLGELPRDKVYIPYCGGVYKSGIAYSVLKNEGFTVKIQA